MKNLLDKIKSAWSIIATIGGSILAILFVLERSKKRAAEDDVEAVKFEVNDTVLKEKQTAVEKRIEKLQSDVQKTESTKVTVPDLTPKEVQDYWKHQ